MNSAQPLEPLGSSQREVSRLTTNFPARITTIYGTSSATLLDLSATGARFALPGDCDFAYDFNERTEAELKWFEFEVFGTLKWANMVDENIEVGIQFDHPLSHRILLGTRELYREFRKQDGYTAMVQHAAREWAQGK